MSASNGRANVSISGGHAIGEQPNKQSRHRHQSGSLIRKNGSWHARYYDDLGQHSAVLGRLKDFPTKKSIASHFEQFMAEVNQTMLGTDDPLFVPFVEDVYFPALRLEKSTVGAYQDMWRLHVRNRVERITLGEFAPTDGYKLLESVAKEGLSRTTVAHIKHFLSGIYAFARQNGHFSSANPIAGLKLPKAKPPEDTYAYSLVEEQTMMSSLSGMARVAVAVASWTGLDKGELEGLRWEDLKNGDLYVQRKVWEGHVKNPKTEARKAPVPVITPLAELLAKYHVQCGSPTEGWLFAASRGTKPIRLSNIARRHIIPNLPKGAWHGWHAFRRGLATNLRAMGVPDDIIQRVLRHGDISTAQRFYSKTLDQTVRDAMRKFGQSV
jgi:integrase